MCVFVSLNVWCGPFMQIIGENVEFNSCGCMNMDCACVRTYLTDVGGLEGGREFVGQFVLERVVVSARG